MKRAVVVGIRAPLIRAKLEVVAVPFFVAIVRDISGWRACGVRAVVVPVVVAVRGGGEGVCEKRACG